MPSSANLVAAALLLLCWPGPAGGVRDYNSGRLEQLRSSVSAMFHHAYDGYLRHAHPFDELRPLSCDGVDTWGSYQLTLIDALDTLIIMGNASEFRRVYGIISQRDNFDADINVSVFETNIRILGGLISGHLFARRAGVSPPGWPCEGPLLRLAEDVARRLLPAFDTPTAMPYGTVNLRHGVPDGETPVTCTAGVGTMIVEFGALSRLTGDPIYEETALRALRSLWHRRSKIGLVGNHVDVVTGKWTATDAGIGAGVDSYYEYLVKGGILLQRPELIKMFRAGQEAVEQYIKHDDWHFWVSMHQGQVTMPVFQSLEAFWPGALSLLGENMKAMKTMHNYHQVWKQYGFLPEFYNVAQSGVSAKREGYPLRPELVESAMYLYRATGDPFLLSLGEDMLSSIEFSAKTECGYATVKNVRDHTLEDRMESFFLAETTKYLYLLFDPDNFIHNPGNTADIAATDQGECIVDAGGYIFNTEAHPIDPAALACCSTHTQEEIRSHMATHMLDVMDPTYFKEFQGDLIPARLQQIEKVRKEEEENRRRKQVEYELKMAEQREKERESRKRKKELEERRRRMREGERETLEEDDKGEEEEETMAKQTQEEGAAEPKVSENLAGLNLSIAEGLQSDDDDDEEEEDEDKHEEEKPSKAQSESGKVIPGTVERLRGGVVEKVSGPAGGEETTFTVRKEEGESQQPEFSAKLEQSGEAVSNDLHPPVMIKRQSKDEVAVEISAQGEDSREKLALDSNVRKEAAAKTVAEALANIINKFLPSSSGPSSSSSSSPSSPIGQFDLDDFRAKVMVPPEERVFPLNRTWYDEHFALGCPPRTFRERFSLLGEFFEEY